MVKHLKQKEKHFKCLANCGKCCGYVLIPKETYNKHKARRQVEVVKEIDMGEKVGPLTADLQCVFLNRQTKLCSIHNDRPQICRDFGLSERLPCPYLTPTGEKR